MRTQSFGSKISYLQSYELYKEEEEEEWSSKYFDIAYRRSKRRFQKQQQNELLQTNKQSQQDFWRQLGIGPERKPLYYQTVSVPAMSSILMQKLY